MIDFYKSGMDAVIPITDPAAIEFPARLVPCLLPGITRHRPAFPPGATGVSTRSHRRFGPEPPAFRPGATGVSARHHPAFPPGAAGVSTRSDLVQVWSDALIDSYISRSC